MAAGQVPEVEDAAGVVWRIACAPAAAGASRVSMAAAPRARRNGTVRTTSTYLDRNAVHLKWIDIRPIRPMCEHVFALIVCAQIPRFELAVAAGGREALAAGPVTLAPETGREQLIGQASAAAEAYGVRAGLRLGEALARCPTLRLVPPDPAGVADEWERLVGLLEGIGAAVESGRPGLAWFDAQGLKTIHGGSLEGVVAAARRALAVPVRVGAAPSRFAALAAASAARARRAEVAPSGAVALRAYL